MITGSQQHPRASRAVPHPSTGRAFCCLTSEFEWDRVDSAECGRWRTLAYHGRTGRPHNSQRHVADPILAAKGDTKDAAPQTAQWTPRRAILRPS